MIEDGSEDEFEIVLDGDSKRGLTNISLSQQQKSPSQSASGVASQQQREITTLDPAAFGAALGMLNGQSIYDVDLDSEYGGPAADKPWRKPGADITDYFNFGFNETTWRMYCIKQRMLREEYGNAKNNSIPPILLNNPMILQGLYPKGTFYFYVF
jgi:pre-mRNA 3'-end-processing factor FIP1